MAVPKWGLAIITVAALTGAGLSGWLYTEQQQLQVQMATLNRELTQVRQGVREDQHALVRAVAEAIALRLRKVEGDLEDLTEALFGFGSTVALESDVINEIRDRLSRLEARLDSLRFCINSLMNDLTFGNGFLTRC